MDRFKIGSFIKDFRNERELSLDEFSHIIGEPTDTILAWENDLSSIEIRQLENLSRKLNVSVNEIVCGTVIKDEVTFRECADNNLINIIKEKDKIRIKKPLLAFLEGGGVGIIISTINFSNLNNKTVMAIIGCVMILISWIYRWFLMKSE